jgi:hypothetical protein
MAAVLSYGTLTGVLTKSIIDSADTGYDPDEVPVEGSLIIRPDIDWFTLSGETVFLTPIKTTLAGGVISGPNGGVGLRLVASDTPGISNPGFTWGVYYELIGVKNPAPVHFKIPAGGIVDISTLVPVAASSGVPVTQGVPGPPGPPGPPGQSGQSNYLKYRARVTSQSGDPGAGMVIWDTVAQLSAANLTIDILTQDSLDATVGLADIQPGDQIYIQEYGNAANFMMWQVNTVTNSGGYFTYGVTLVNSGGTANTGNGFAGNLIIAIQVFFS